MILWAYVDKSSSFYDLFIWFTIITKAIFYRKAVEAKLYSKRKIDKNTVKMCLYQA